MAMLFMPNPLPLTDLETWVRPDTKTAHGDKGRALAVLSRLHIATSTITSKDEPPALRLTTEFANSLRLALTGGGNHGSFGIPSNISHPEIGIEYLDKYAKDQWEGILHYVVHTRNDSSGARYPTESVRALLSMGETPLVDAKHYERGVGITQTGFAFLLQETNAQVWAILLRWLEYSEELGIDKVDLLSFFFLLGSLELGIAYSTSTISESQRNILPVMQDLGLLYLPNSGSYATSGTEFFPTRLATTLTSSAAALRTISSGVNAATADNAGGGFIVIETNYRLYAYTSSPLQIAVLSLFCKLSTRFPNMVTGRVTRQSIRVAIEHGITSDQIISYLSTHAHPQMRKKAPILPPTVVDQIRLWQIENERMQATPGYLFKDFSSQVDYDACATYADEIGVLAYKNEAKRIFFVTKVEQLRDYIKSRKLK